MSLVIKKHSHTRASTARIFRGIAKLSDGKFAALTFNSNITAKSGSSSEKNNTPKLYVVIFNSDWSTFLTASIQVGTANAKQTIGQIASMAIDSSNNIHVVYNYRTSPQTTALKDQGQTLQYRKVTYNGTTLTVGSETTVFSTAGYYSGVDIDVPIGTAVAANPVIAFVHSATGSTFATRLTQIAGLQTTQIESVDSAGRGVSLALNNATDATSYRWLATTYQLEAGTDVGDTIILGSGTTSSAPTVESVLAQNLNVGLGDGMRHLAAFRHSDSIIVTGAVAANPYTHFFAGYSVPTSGTPTILLSPTNINVGGKYVANAGYQFAAVQLDTTDTAVVCHLSDGKNIYAQVFDYVVSGGVLTITTQSTTWRMDQQYLGKNISPSLIYNGDRSLNGTVDISCIVDFPEAYLYVLYTRVPASGKITAVMTIPATGGTLNKSNSTISVTVSGTSNNNVVGRVQVQTSKDANFLTEVNDFYSDYQTFLKSVTVSINLPSGVLGQGTYYARTRIQDQLGFVYSWNDTQTFKVAHKPIASIASPVRGATAVYNGDGTVTFKLGFTDPDTTDYQTAYRIQVTNLLGTALADTGKVTSDASTINVAIGSGSVDADLIINAWVWDSDNVQSDMTTSDFHLAVQPTVAWDYPDGATVETATPTYSWEIAVPGTRTQAQYRVTVYKGSTLVYDSKILSGDADTFIQPAGYLKNNTTYKATIWVKDSLGMTASAQVTFPTGWQKPVACPAPHVDLSLYDELGYAYITIVPPTVDADILPNTKIALMRRSLFSNDDWEEVEALQMGVGLNYSVIDSTLPGGVTSYYAAVLQIDIGGDYAVGYPDDSVSTKINTPASNYWLVSTDNPEKNTPIPIVNQDSYTDEKEQETLTIANRGRWVDNGDILGVNGSMQSRVYDRENNLGGAPIMNYVQNPRLLATGTGLTGIANWTLANANYLTRKTYSPCPIGKDVCIAYGMTGGTDATISQTISRTAGNHLLSVWVETSYITAAAGKSITITAVAKNAAGATLGTYSQAFALTQSGSAMIPTGAVVYASQIGTQFQWYRLNKTLTAPPGTTSIVVTVTLHAVAGDYLTMGGVMLIDSLNTAIKFFDGYTYGAEWMREDALNSASFTAGKVTARSARRRVMKLANSDDTLYLRTPFGDVYQVSAGQIQVERIAGTGANEFVNMTIPYLELGLES